MTIDRLGGVKPLENIQKPSRTQRAQDVDFRDSIAVSDEAKELAEVYKAMEIVSAAPDIRTDRVAEVQEKLKNPDYINKAVVDLVADRFLDTLGI